MAELILSLLAIFLGATLFTNGVEWLGRKLDLSHGATGSLIAAMGTALPEAIIPIWAIAFGASHVKEQIGVGAILGAPLLLATLALLISGLAAFYYAHRRQRTAFIEVDPGTLERDLGVFVVVYTLAAAAGLVDSRALRTAIGLLLVATYIGYVVWTLRRPSPDLDEAEAESHRLFFQRRREVPDLWAVVLQAVVALGIIVFAAHTFVDSVQAVAAAWGVSAFLLSVVVTPIATELPETFNSVIWLGQKKDTLAMSNITGAMVFQSSMIPAIGILFTPWQLQSDQLWAAGVAIAAAALVFVTYLWRRRVLPQILVFNGLLYGLYLLVVL
ncbi:MAG: sodium:calcium antiporter [Firmicutes bacterium]|nr:sodium:calcium antiporter [Bacillota bacterium]